jgi:hypothetical protein
VDGRRGFWLSGRLNVGRLLRAEVLRVIEATTPDEANSPTVVAPTGFEPVFKVMATFRQQVRWLQCNVNGVNGA